MNRIAVIVIGSNSTRMLAADACDQLTNEMKGRVETRLFLGMSDERVLSDESIAYTAQSVADLKHMAEESGAKLIGVYATSASRDAKNSSQLSARIQSATGHPLTILSGEEEAAYSFFGAAGDDHCMVIDIGGGSTEVVIGQGMHIECAHSLQLGASRLFKAQPVNSKCDAIAAKHIAMQAIRTLPAALQDFCSIGTIYLIGGTGTSAARVLGCAPEGCIITADTIEQLLFSIADTPRADRALIPGFPPTRIDILPTGMAILSALFETLHLPSVLVTERVNAHGILRAFVHKKFA